MKKFIFLICLILSYNCQEKEKPSYEIFDAGSTTETKKNVVIVKSATTKLDFSKSADELCVIGKSYIICSGVFETDNPFVENNFFTVIIIDKRNGWVQYCHDEDVNDSDSTKFHRTVGDFIEIVRECNKLKR